MCSLHGCVRILAQGSRENALSFAASCTLLSLVCNKDLSQKPSTFQPTGPPTGTFTLSDNDTSNQALLFTYLYLLLSTAASSHFRTKIVATPPPTCLSAKSRSSSSDSTYHIQIFHHSFQSINTATFH